MEEVFVQIQKKHGGIYRSGVMENILDIISTIQVNGHMLVVELGYNFNMKNSSVYGVIYLITNLINGKCYIGQTVQYYPIQRWLKHCQLANKGDKRPLYHSIRKNGRRNFSFQILWHAFSKDALDLMENVFIKEYQSMAPFGYNLHEGGAWGRHLPETRIKISEASKMHMKNAEFKKKSIETLRNAQKNPLVEAKRVFNGRKIRSHNTSGYLGVSLNAKKWRAQIVINKKHMDLGRFSNKEFAAKAYDMAVIYFLGDIYSTNFPKENYL